MLSVVAIITAISGVIFVKYTVFKPEVIYLDNEEVPSINKIDNEKSAVGMKIENTEMGTSKTYVYRDNDNSFSKNLYNYFLMLKDKEGFEIVDIRDNINATNGALELGKKSKDDGKVIVIDMYYSEKGFELVYRKDVGAINNTNS